MGSDKNPCCRFPGDDGGSVGPARSSSGGANEGVLGNICCRRGTENFANLQTFDSCSTFPHKSPGDVEMMRGLGLTFTNEQWKELERQAMIYKYMMSSVPVPPHLLFPISNNFPHSVSLIYDGRVSKNGDLEPGRCKRTDGKKWRCARDVALHQKYCDRHLHRGRPRSRKPVEVKNNDDGENHHHNKKTRLEQSGPSFLKAQSDANSSQQFVTRNNEPLMLFDAKTDLRISTPYQKGTDRDLDLVMENDAVGKHGIEQPWPYLLESNMGILTNDEFSDYKPIFNQDYSEQLPLNIFNYPDFPAQEIEEAPIGFIDCRSIDNLPTRDNGINLEDNLSPSLDLSMAMAHSDDRNKAKDPIWPGAFSCGPFTRGGPLGEALHAAVGSNPASPPYNSVVTNVSSPSGVIQRTLFSYSDGSVCNSPTTFGAPPSEVSIKWFN